MALTGAFRAIEDRYFAVKAGQANDIYIEHTKALGNLLHLHYRSFGSSYGCSGFIYYLNWAISGMIDTVECNPSIARLLHNTLIHMVNVALRVRLGKGQLRVLAERVKTLPAGLLLPATNKLLHDYERNIWQPNEYLQFSSIWPEFSPTLKILLHKQETKEHQLTELLHRLSLNDNAGDILDPERSESMASSTSK